LKDGSAEFVFIDGELDSGPGPGVSGTFEPPYYTYFKWPRAVKDPDDDLSVEAAYQYIYDVLEGEDGPFDGILGFSHGATLAFGFLVHHAKRDPQRDLGLRCAIFMSSLPPFRQFDTGELLFDAGMQGHMHLPSLTIAGRKDFVFEHTLRLASLCDPAPAQLLIHDQGHEVPRDSRNVREIAAAIRRLGDVAMLMR
jgi:predicted esterase